MSIKSVSLFGKFSKDVKGIMSMIDGMKMPFTIIECIDEKSFSTKSELGNICITFVHMLEQHDEQIKISHKIIVDGGEKKQEESIGEKVSCGLCECLQKLLALSNE